MIQSPDDMPTPPDTLYVFSGTEDQQNPPTEIDVVTRAEFQALQDSFESHQNNVANPHNTTPQQIGAVSKTEYAYDLLNTLRQIATINHKQTFLIVGLIASLVTNAVVLYKVFGGS